MKLKTYVVGRGTLTPPYSKKTPSLYWLPLFKSFLFLIVSLADQSGLPTVTLVMGERMGAPINSCVTERVLPAPF